MLIGTAGDALALGRGQEDGAAQGGRADEDLGGFLGHQQRTEDRLGRGADGDDAVILQEDDLGVAAGAFDERHDLPADGLREAEAGFGIRDEDGFDAAHDDLVRAGATLGEFVGMGSSCGVVVRLDPITFVAGASEKQALKVKVGAAARVKLPDGREVVGQVDKLASVVDPQTRNFEIKVSVPNANNAIPVGRTAEIKINIGLGRAHKISKSLLKADSTGRIGVYYLDVGGVIGFAPADIVDESADGVWVTGLSDEAQLVAEGQDNIATGLRVTPVVREPVTGGG